MEIDGRLFRSLPPSAAQSLYQRVSRAISEARRMFVNEIYDAAAFSKSEFIGILR